MLRNLVHIHALWLFSFSQFLQVVVHIPRQIYHIDMMFIEIGSSFSISDLPILVDIHGILVTSTPALIIHKLDTWASERCTWSNRLPGASLT